jgi:acetyltransferase-like isoleucine patch superfamily enzyme
MNNNTRDIFERDLSGEVIPLHDPEYCKIAAVIDGAQKIIAELNSAYHDEVEVRALFSRLTGVQVDETFTLLPPFYTDFGRNIRVGKRVFINHCCEFMDRGGITIYDDVLIAPKVNLITIGHPLQPAERRATRTAPIIIKNGVWIGANVTIMPGVTVGENAVVAAGAVVSKDVPDNTVGGGSGEATGLLQVITDYCFLAPQFFIYD